MLATSWLRKGDRSPARHPSRLHLWNAVKASVKLRQVPKCVSPGVIKTMVRYQLEEDN